MTLEQALELFSQPKRRRGAAAPKGPLRELGTDPNSGLPVSVWLKSAPRVRLRRLPPRRPPPKRRQLRPQLKRPPLRRPLPRLPPAKPRPLRPAQLRPAPLRPLRLARPKWVAEFLSALKVATGRHRPGCPAALPAAGDGVGKCTADTNNRQSRGATVRSRPGSARK